MGCLYVLTNTTVITFLKVMCQIEVFQKTVRLYRKCIRNTGTLFYLATLASHYRRFA